MKITKATINFYKLQIKKITKLLKDIEKETKNLNTDFENFFLKAELIKGKKELTTLLKHYKITLEFINHYNNRYY